MFKTLFNYQKINFILVKNSHRVLALMLLTLHAFLIWGNGQNYLKQTLFLCTYAVFLLWQPIWRSTEKLSRPALAIFIGIGLIGFTYTSWWLTALWLSILFGLLGGRIFSEDTKANRVY